MARKGKIIGGVTGGGSAAGTAVAITSTMSGAEIVALLATAGSMATGIGVVVVIGGAAVGIGIWIGSWFD